MNVTYGMNQRIKHALSERSQLPCLLCLFLFSGCIGELDTKSRVHDLRVLAMAATPSEVRLQDIDLVAMNIPIQLDVLAPKTNERAHRHYAITTCPDPENGRCEGRELETLLAEGDVTGDEFTAHIQFNASHLELMTKALEKDPYYGFGGLPVTLALKLTQISEEGTVEETAHAFKKLVFWLPVEGMSVAGEATNTNPLPPEITFNANGDGETFVPWDNASLLNENEWALDGDRDKLDEARPEYRLPTFQGGEITLWESWTYEWFTTKGKFSPETTGGTNPVTQKPMSAQTKLVFDEDDEDGPFRGWCVKRDGRGGVGWTSFSGVLKRDIQ